MSELQSIQYSRKDLKSVAVDWVC